MTKQQHRTFQGKYPFPLPPRGRFAAGREAQTDSPQRRREEGISPHLWSLCARVLCGERLSYSDITTFAPAPFLACGTPLRAGEGLGARSLYPACAM
jgi:hypothetical protein